MTQTLTVPCLACGGETPMGARKVDLCVGCWLRLDHDTRMAVINAYATKDTAPGRFRTALDAAVIAAVAVRPLETVETTGGVL